MKPLSTHTAPTVPSPGSTPAGNTAPSGRTPTAGATAAAGVTPAAGAIATAGGTATAGTTAAAGAACAGVRPPHFDGRALLLAAGVLLWLAMAMVGPPLPAHAAAAPPPAPPTRPPLTGHALTGQPVTGPPLPVGTSLADVLRRFDPPPLPWAAGHRGVDVAAPVGAAVRSVRGGVVSFAGTIAGTGVVAVTHPGTGEPPLRTTYEPVDPLVAPGAKVTAGEIVGRVSAGPLHCPSRCLHWGLLRGRRYLDPLALVGLGHARLLPPDGSSGGQAAG